MLEHQYLTFSFDLWSNISVIKNKLFLIKIIYCQFFLNIYFYTNLVIIIIFSQTQFQAKYPAQEDEEEDKGGDNEEKDDKQEDEEGQGGMRGRTK